MEDGNSNKRKFKERQRKAKQRANQTPDKIQERRAADLRNKARAKANETPEKAQQRRATDSWNKARARANETPEKAHERIAADSRNKARARANETSEKAHERRAADLRNKTRARLHETPEQAHERREANLRNVRRHRSNHTPAEIQETINANSRIEEMVSIPRISEFVEVTDSKAKAFHHILKTRIRHDEQLSHEILDFIQNQGRFKGSGDSSSIPLYEQCHQANVCVCCDRFICGTDELHWIKKNTLLQQKSRLILPNLKNELQSCYTVLDPELQGLLLSPRAKEWRMFMLFTMF